MPSHNFCHPGCVYHFCAISLNSCAVNCLSCLLRASPWQWEPASTSRSLPQSSYQGTLVIISTNVFLSEYQPTKMITWIFFSNKPQLCLPLLSLSFLLLRTQTLGTEFRVGCSESVDVQNWLFKIGCWSDFRVQRYLEVRPDHAVCRWSDVIRGALEGEGALDYYYSICLFNLLLFNYM